MKSKSWALILVMSSCETAVTSTFVEGSVQGVSVPAAAAVSATGRNLFGSVRHTVWLGSGLVCSELRTATLEQADAFGPSFVATADGGRAPSLIIDTDGNASFDTGNGAERLRGTSKLTLQKVESNGNLSARYTATFSSGAGTDTVTGEYIATPCASANPGCSASSGLLVAAAALWFARRKLVRFEG